MHVPFAASPRYPPVAAGRFAGTFVRAADVSATRAAGAGAVALLGLPDDTGVSMNGGRPGAREGPAAIRAALSRYGVAELAGGRRWPRVVDCGDVMPGATLEETHDRVTAACATLVGAGLFPIGLGGGHDLTLPFVRAVARAHGPLCGVYADAHLDVRAEPGSGMAFRRLVEEGLARDLHVVGCNPLVNRADHVAWFQAHRGVIADGPSTAWPAGRTFVSFDIDAVDAAHAPGVSAPNPCGLSTREACAFVAGAGSNPEVVCFDLMELSPVHDADGRTARLAAHLLLTFLEAWARRPG